MKTKRYRDQNFFRGKFPSDTANPYSKLATLNGKAMLASPIEEKPKRMNKNNLRQLIISEIQENPESRLLTWVLTDQGQKLSEKRRYRLSHHCLQRTAQRGIQADAIALTLEFGKVYRRQGMLFHVLGKKELPPIHQHDWERLPHTVVVMSEDDTTLITAYRADNPFRKIRRKPKVLLSFYSSKAAA